MAVAASKFVSFAHPLAQLESGAVLGGRYRIEEELGSGGLGVVYKARHVGLDALVAIKVLRPEYAYDDELVERLEDEARLAAGLRSDHVVRVLDVGEMAAGARYIVLEYVVGHDLEVELARRGRLPLGTAMAYGLDVCAALAEVHGRGVVHRDIKPENLLIEDLSDGRRRVKVADFGAAKRLRARRGASSFDAGGYVGTPWYMAPEQILDSRHVDARADIWSLGVVLYEMLTDHLPFSGLTPPEVYTSVICGDASPIREHRPEVPAELEWVVGRCLEKDVARRSSDVGEVAFALRALGPYATLTPCSPRRPVGARARMDAQRS